MLLLHHAGRRKFSKRFHHRMFIIFSRSVRINFQYAVDVLCGSLNRACDVKKLFQYIGLKNSQSPIRIEFVFANGTHYDTQLQRTFQPSRTKMFACDEPVILPHISKAKCTCMDCNAMCPKINQSRVAVLPIANDTLIDRVRGKLNNLHHVTIIAIGVYILFVLAFIFSLILLSIRNLTNSKKKAFVKSKREFWFERN